MLNKLLCTSACSLAMLAALPAFAVEPPLTSLPVIVVTADEVDTLTVPGNAMATRVIKQTPGGVAVVGAQEFEDKYTLNFEDTLSYVPGVYAQKRFGEEVRLSMRGSGLSRGFHLRGLDLLQDGIPFNLADGSADFQEADSLAVQRIEVLKGANALQYGGSTLGGAVNMVSKTGRSNPGDAVRLEGGSFETYRFHTESGRVFGESDVFLSLTGTTSEAFREHDDQQNVKFNGNIGTKVSDDVETRFNISGNIIEQELPGAVSLATVMRDPAAADPSSIADDQRRDVRSFRLSNKTSFDLGAGDKLDVGAFLSLKDLFHPITPFVGVIDQESTDYGVFAQGSGEGALAGHRNRFRLGVTTHLGEVAAKIFQNLAGSRGALLSDGDQTSQNATLYGENHFFVLPQWALVTGTQLSQEKRELENHLIPANSDSHTYRSFNPQVGVLYEPREELQFFANVSKSHEPPTFSELTQGGAAGFQPLDPQKAWTAEIGSRGSHGLAAWDVSLYRAWIRDEMLQFTPGVGIPAATFNAGDTVHQGVELGLEMKLAQSLFSEGDGVKLRNAYTFSDYAFDNDPQYGDNTIAGQPKHFYQAELRYDHADGWYIAPNVEFAGDAEVDFSNTLEAPGYGLVGLGAGYDITPDVSLFAEGRNLLDKKYVATYSTIVNTAGNTSVFYPGDGRSFYAGMTVRF